VRERAKDQLHIKHSEHYSVHTNVHTCGNTKQSLTEIFHVNARERVRIILIYLLDGLKPSLNRSRSCRPRPNWQRRSRPRILGTFSR